MTSSCKKRTVTRPVSSFPDNGSRRRLRRRVRRDRIRRLKVASISLVSSLGLVLQDVQAERLIINGPPSRQFVSSRPSWFAVAAESAGKWIRSVVDVRNWGLSLGGVASSGVGTGGSPKSWQAADPVGPFSAVNLATGNLFTSVPIVSWDGVSFSLFHNGRSDTGVPALGSGWSHTYSAHLEHDDQAQPPTMTLLDDDGTTVEFTRIDPTPNAEVWRNSALRLTVTERGGGWLLTDAQQNLRVFDFEGRLSSVEDSSGNSTKFKYDSDERLFAVIDSQNRTLELDFDSQNRLSHVPGPARINGQYR